MPLSPDEAAKKNLDNVDAKLKSAIVLIDKELSAKYYGDNTVCISIEGCHELVKKEVLRLYREAGWEITAKSSSHRNEHYEQFTFCRRPEPGSCFGISDTHNSDIRNG